MKKQEKLNFIETFLLTRQEGASRADIARAMGVHRSTVSRCIDDLSIYIPIAEDDNKKLSINKFEYLNNIKLTLHEVFALYLSARLLSLSFGPYSPHMYSSLLKLAQAAGRVSPIIGNFIKSSAEYALPRKKENWKNKIKILEILTRAWAENKKISIKYKSKKSSDIHKYTVSVYFMEPYTAGRSIYMFGLVDDEDIIRTFRTDRITEAVITEQLYNFPDEFDFSQLFSNAWRIWDAGGIKKQITIHFSKKVSERVLETQWHPAQKIRKQKDGTIFFSVEITEPLEMVPWIRGWGSDAEVLEPEELRDFMREEARKLAEMYG